MLENVTNNNVSAKPDTLQVYSVSGDSRVSDHLQMKSGKHNRN